ncbi:MAG: TRM11 family SAM-dependent methyltransferase [Culicoidibacterales bacterium]
MDSKYVYIINYPDYEQELCELEQLYLFGSQQQAGKKYRFSDKRMSAGLSPFFRQRLDILCQASSCEKLVQQVQEAQLHFDEFKIHYLKLDGDQLAYHERLQACKEVGYVVLGEANMHNPRVNLGLVIIEGTWILGVMEQHDAKWQHRTSKPHSYSNSLNNKLAKVAVNIACSDIESPTIVDPCCGVGTVVIEAQANGVDIQGYEINPLVAQQARENVMHFGFADVITNGNMHDITQKYDVAIIDIPYGLYAPTTRAEQLAILITAKRIASKLVLLTCDDLTLLLQEAGYTDIHIGMAHKNNAFSRHVCVCK